ncbi:MAG: GSCFA domain-containing protein [Odoribacter sp.]|nr:GSCFA domain-containing protein [Odoribacter sp.]
MEKIATMDLQTVVKIDKPSFQVEYTTRMMLLGSCFVENIGAKLEYFGFQTDINPCGIVYNPLSVASTLDMLLAGRRFEESDLLRNNGKWVSLSHHGDFSATQSEQCLQRINSRLETAGNHLKMTNVLVITWGTAWVYCFRSTGQVVSNCHRFPASDFERFRLEVEEIVRGYADLLDRLREVNPNMQVVFTVSPVRHWKDGAHGNQLSKAVLLLAVNRLQERYEQVSYFPSYEIVMDELRDYRFYGEDMLHLSPQGVEYVWERFKDNYISLETQSRMKKVEKLNKVLQHRPFDADSDATRELYARTQEELHTLLRGFRDEW